MTRRALVISSQIEGLLGADGDADRTAAALAARHFELELRQGSRASRAGILDGLDTLARSSSPGDAVVVYYAGHGSRLVNTDPRAGDPTAPQVPRIGQFIAPTDYRASTDDDFRGISAWELSAKLAAITRRTDNVTVVLDCCHAAQMMRGGEAVGATARTLPWPHKQGVTRYLDALRAGGIDLSVLDPLGNALAIRLFACGEGQAAWEFDTPVGRAGALTEAWLWGLGEVGDHVVGWDVLGALIRERVQRRFATQRPELGGPTQRALFSTAVAPRTSGVPLRRTFGQAEVLAGTLVGTRVGDTFAVLPATPLADPTGLADPTAPPLAIATVTRAMPLASSVALDGWTIDPAALPDDVLALPRTRQLARAPVVVKGQGAEVDRVRARLAAPPRLRVADPTVDDEPPVAVVELDGDSATIVDELGQRTQVRSAGASRADTDAALDALVGRVVDLAVARALRALEGAQGLPPEAAQVTWGTVVAGQLVPLPRDGATLALADTVALQVDNRSAAEVFVHVFDLGIGGRITRLTADSVTGHPLPAGQTWLLAGKDPQGLVGIPQTWPLVLPRLHPRREELVVLVTGSPTDLGILESSQRAARAALPADAGSLVRLCAQLHVGGPRSVGTTVEQGYVLVRIGFWVDPTESPRRS